MIEHAKDATLDDLEIAVDFLENPSVHMVFLGELLDRRGDMLESLIDNGGDEYRYKIQMIDEIINLRDEIIAELKSRKDEDG